LSQRNIDWTGVRNGGRPTVMIRRPPGSKLGKPRQLAWDDRGARALRRFVDLGLLGKEFRNSSLWKAWQRAVEAREAGHEIPNGHMRPYDCRHKRLTEICEATGDIPVTSEVAGHDMRVLKRIVLGVIGAILAVYLLFAIGLTVLEWIVRENPKVEASLRAHSTDPHPLTHYDQGAASFQRRLELVASAKESIAPEFFIYEWMTPPASSRRR
jgi:hypothetical protein